MNSIALIIEYLKNGGAERTVSNLSLELEKYFDVHVIVFDGRNQVYPHGGKLHDLQLPHQTNILARALNLYKRIQKVHKIKKDNNIVCSISFMNAQNLVNILSRKNDVIIVSVRNFLSKSLHKNKDLIITKFICKNSDKIVPLSKLVQEDLMINFGAESSKLVTIYNPCDEKRLADLAEQTFNSPVQFVPHNKYIITMGRLTEQKGQWHLLRAFSSVIRKIPNVKLLILGTGELEVPLKVLAADMGISESTVFTGFVKNPHIIVAKSDLFVFPSLYEGLGNVLLEALAFRKAIIAADCNAGPREILAPDTSIHKKIDDIEYAQYGVLVPVCDPGHFNASDPLTKEENKMAEAICVMLENESLRKQYENKAAQRIQDFSPATIIEQWRSLITGSVINI